MGGGGRGERLFLVSQSLFNLDSLGQRPGEQQQRPHLPGLPTPPDLPLVSAPTDQCRRLSASQAVIRTPSKAEVELRSDNCHLWELQVSGSRRRH